MSIGKLDVKLWPFFYIQDGRQPPSWIFEIRKLQESYVVCSWSYTSLSIREQWWLSGI